MTWLVDKICTDPIRLLGNTRNIYLCDICKSCDRECIPIMVSMLELSLHMSGYIFMCRSRHSNRHIVVDSIGMDSLVNALHNIRNGHLHYRYNEISYPIYLGFNYDGISDLTGYSSTIAVNFNINRKRRLGKPTEYFRPVINPGLSFRSINSLKGKLRPATDIENKWQSIALDIMYSKYNGSNSNRSVFL